MSRYKKERKKRKKKKQKKKKKEELKRNKLIKFFLSDLEELKRKLKQTH